jgi:hypothetical protein
MHGECVLSHPKGAIGSGNARNRLIVASARACLLIGEDPIEVDGDVIVVEDTQNEFSFEGSFSVKVPTKPYLRGVPVGALFLGPVAEGSWA